MPNIAITTYCNLHCPYCFAQQMIKEQNIKNISIETFDNILLWLEPYLQSIHSRIGILGGEPTLHPQFETIMEHTSTICQKYNTSSIIFTNGIELSEKIIKMIPDDTHILINYNHPSIYTKEQYNKLQNNLELLSNINWINPKKVNLGITLCEQIKDYSFIKEAIKKYNLKKLRLAVNRANGLWNNFDYYNNIKTQFLDLIQFFIDMNLMGHIDIECRIPISFFSNEEQELIFQVIPKEQYLSSCYPSFEIFPNFTMTSCFTLYKHINCKDYTNFKNFVDLNNIELNKGIQQNVE